jgi:hypothetical protein
MRSNAADKRQDVALKFVAEEQALRKTAAEESRPSKTSRVSRNPIVRPTLLDELLRKAATEGGRMVRPYIILPRSSKCLLNLLNGREFLENKKYVSPERVTDDRGRRLDLFKAEAFDVTAKINGKDIVFRVVDDISHFTKWDWLLTVAVFIDGSRWQFNKWPFGSIADLFATIKGFHLAYDQTATPRYTNTFTGEMWSAAQKEMVGNVVVDPFPVVKYTVKRSTISRHVDALCVYQFWKEIEEFLLKPRIAKYANGQTL